MHVEAAVLLQLGLLLIVLTAMSGIAWSVGFTAAPLLLLNSTPGFRGRLLAGPPDIGGAGVGGYQLDLQFRHRLQIAQ